MLKITCQLLTLYIHSRGPDDSISDGTGVTVRGCRGQGCGGRGRNGGWDIGDGISGRMGLFPIVGGVVMGEVGRVMVVVVLVMGAVVWVLIGWSTQP